MTVMLAKDYDKSKVTDWKSVWAEPKLNGVRVYITYDPDDGIVYRSRNNRILEMFTHLNRPVEKLYASLCKVNSDYYNGVMIDGEMMADSFGDVSGAIHRKDHIARYCWLNCFFVMPLHVYLNKPKDCVPQSSRRLELITARKVLSSSKKVVFTDATPCSSHEDIMAAHGEHKEHGYEGTMVKDYSKPYEPVRSHTWMKIKDELTVDVRVVRIKPGTGKYEGMCGALVCDYNGVEVPVSGMTDAQRKKFSRWPRSIIGKLVEVEYQEETVHGSLRHPRFKCVRADKDEAP